MKIFEIIGGHLLLEYAETRVQGILKNKQKMDKLLQAAQADRAADVDSTVASNNQEDPESHPAESVLRAIADFDPTEYSKYLNWIVDRYIDGDFSVEDREAVFQTLSGFQQYQNRLEIKDINQYKRLSDIRRAVQPLRQADAPTSARQERKRNKEADYREGDIETIIDGSRYRVHVPKSQAAMNYLAWLNIDKDSIEWCTTTGRGEQFDSYSKDGTLYQISVDLFKENPRKFLLHYESGQFMNEQDDPIESSDIDFLSGFPEHKQFLDMLIKKHYGKYLDNTG